MAPRVGGQMSQNAFTQMLEDNNTVGDAKAFQSFRET